MTGAASVRLDIWLWRARMFKTRGMSAEAIEGRGVRIDRAGQVRKVNKPAAPVTPGDVLTFSRGGHIVTLELLDIGQRRGPPAEARLLYRDLTPGVSPAPHGTPET